MILKRLFAWFISLLLFFVAIAQPNKKPSSQKTAKTITFTQEQLKDKIKGGWAGQTIGVTFRGPYEFRFNGTYIQEYQPLFWYNGYLKETMLNIPGLYDES